MTTTPAPATYVASHYDFATGESVRVEFVSAWVGIHAAARKVVDKIGKPCSISRKGENGYLHPVSLVGDFGFLRPSR